MKRDGRPFDQEALEKLRLLAVERVRNGEPASEAIAAYGFNRTTIYKWLAAAKQAGVGVNALRSGKRTGRLRVRARPDLLRSFFDATELRLYDSNGALKI